MSSPAERSRVAVIVPRHRQTVVARNRLKRRLRELVRLEMLPALAGRRLDIVVRAAPRAYARSFDEMRGEIRRAVAAVMPPPPAAAPA